VAGAARHRVEAAPRLSACVTADATDRARGQSVPRVAGCRTWLGGWIGWPVRRRAVVAWTAVLGGL